MVAASTTCLLSEDLRAFVFVVDGGNEKLLSETDEAGCSVLLPVGVAKLLNIRQANRDRLAFRPTQGACDLL